MQHIIINRMKRNSTTFDTAELHHCPKDMISAVTHVSTRTPCVCILSIYALLLFHIRLEIATQMYQMGNAIWNICMHWPPTGGFNHNICIKHNIDIDTCWNSDTATQVCTSINYWATSNVCVHSFSACLSIDNEFHIEPHMHAHIDRIGG